MSLPRAAERLLERIDPGAIRLGLEAPRRLLKALGEPQREFATVLVAGTNGKGTTAAWLAAMATAAGYRTGLYTSPHLEELRERVRVDGRAVSGEELGGWLVAAGEAAQAELGGLPTYFELVTTAACRGFAAAGVELAVLEVGLGGRLDATNATEPVLSIVTEIGLDHEQYLGSSLAQIAGEKAGILRRDRPAVLGCRKPEALAALRRAAGEIGAELIVAADAARQGEEDESPGVVALATSEARYRLRHNLAGRHQDRNLVLAVLAAERLRRLGWERLDESAIRTGAAACRWPGRLESVGLELPAARRREILLDVAHNPDAAVALAAHLERLEGPYDLLFGTLTDKRSERMLPLLAAGAERLVLARPAGDRGRDPRELLPLVPGDRAVVEPQPARALERALEGDAPTLVVCGSFYLVGEVRRALRRRFGAPPPAASIATC